MIVPNAQFETDFSVFTDFNTLLHLFYTQKHYHHLCTVYRLIPHDVCVYSVRKEKQ